ncbi:hypothetical protein TPA0598_07_05990 [Streptomyces lydicamycinicus]|uniref:Uncharacterized protein n=1 Tax=Streptomyces lydicamycinicus TaxID=1546107 RepID=A0A0N7YM81_9ACTN|nr:hypothetical protein [Streptomyces lydicamycinicus]GAO10875.1 hypothetical protein TPA0598_07_05990 [Streptomyces lydicamycinicus]
MTDSPALNKDHLMALTIYNQLFAALTGTSPGAGGSSLQPAFPADQTYLTLEPAGRFVDPKDYARPWTPGNMKGSLSAALNLAQLADEIHLTNPVTTRSTDKLSAVYGTILRANVNEPEPSQEIKEKHEAAFRVLYRTVKVTDEDTGEVTEKTVPSVAYREYRKLEQAYQAALSAYQGAYLEAHKTPEGAETWPLIAPTQRMPVTAAWDDWRGADAGIIESALAVVNTTENKAVAIAFSKAGELFSSYATSLQGPSAAVTYRSTVIPSGWVSAEEAEDWPTVTISAGTTVENDSKEAYDYAVNGNYGLGFWGFNVGGSGEGREERERSDEATKDLEVSFKYCLCTISRPWLDGTLFRAPYWSVSGWPPHQVSDGTRAQEGTSLPMLPTAFLCVRDVKITAKWGRKDIENAQRASKSSADVGWGPFKMGGFHSSDSAKSHHMRAQWDGRTLTQPGLQIIGWVHTIVPACPPERG